VAEGARVRKWIGKEEEEKMYRVDHRGGKREGGGEALGGGRGNVARVGG